MLTHVTEDSILIVNDIGFTLHKDTILFVSMHARTINDVLSPKNLYKTLMLT